MKKNWNEIAWNDYLYWQEHDKAKVKRINELLKAIERDPFKGIGEPEPLKHNLRGWWSRQIEGIIQLTWNREISTNHS